MEDGRKRSGGKRRPSADEIQELRVDVNHRDNINIFVLADKHNVGETTIFRYMGKVLGIKARCKKKSRKYTDKEAALCKITPRRLLDHLLNGHGEPLSVILDDEMYIDTNGHIIHGSKRYYTDAGKVSDAVRYKQEKKLLRKLRSGLRLAIRASANRLSGVRD